MLTVQPRRAPSAVDWIALFGTKATCRANASISLHGERLDSSFQVLDELADPSVVHSSRDSRTAVLFDGVLYNQQELQRTLDQSPAASDAALVAAAFARWGEDFLHHIKGIFALVVWDSAAGRVIAARDPFGEYPLFFAGGNGRELLVSISIDALLADPRVSRTLNRAALADHLCQRWPDPTETFFDAVRRVPPGHRLVSTTAGLKIDRYWDPLPVDRPVNWVSEDELEEFDARLEVAVERVCRGRTGLLLSGGLDSVTVGSAAVDLARRSRTNPPLAFSVAYPGLLSEEPTQRAVASALGMEHAVIPFWEGVPQGSLVSEALRLTQTMPVLMHSPWTPVYEHVLRLARARGVQTVLTGNGGDELMSPIPIYIADAMRTGNLVGLVGHLAAWKRSFNAPKSWYTRGMLWTYGVRALGVSVADQIFPKTVNRRRIRRSMQFAPEYVAPDSGLQSDLERRVRTSLKPKPWGSLYLQELRARLNHTLDSWAREESFERGRRLGLHFSHPLLDADLAAMVYRIPQRLIYKDGRSKYLFRRRLERRIPGLGFDRQKKLGAGGFFRSILASELPGIWGRTQLTALGQLGVVDVRGAGEMVVRAFNSENTRSLLPVWELLRLEAWAKSRL